MMIMVSPSTSCDLLMTPLLALTSFAGLIMAMQAAKGYFTDKKLDHMLMFCMFLNMCTGTGYIGYLYMDHQHSGIQLVWGVLIVQSVLLLAPVFYRRFWMLAADRGAIWFEASILLMLVGSMCIVVNDFHFVPYIAISSISLFYAGYKRLCHLLKHNQNVPEMKQTWHEQNGGNW